MKPSTSWMGRGRASALAVLAFGTAVGVAASGVDRPPVSAVSQDRSVALTLSGGRWPGCERAIIRVRADGRYPRGPTDGDGVADVSLAAGEVRLLHSGLRNGRTYFYAIYGIDSKGRLAASDFLAATPAVTHAPPIVQNLRRTDAR